MWRRPPAGGGLGLERPPPKGGSRRGADGGPPARWVSFIAAELSALHLFLLDLEARQTDFHGRIEERVCFHFIFLNSENKYFHNEMSHDYSC